jgi:hypothetical protein
MVIEDKYVRIWIEEAVDYLKSLSRHSSGNNYKNHENLNPDCGCPVPDSNRVPVTLQVKLLAATQTCSVIDRGCLALPLGM